MHASFNLLLRSNANNMSTEQDGYNKVETGGVTAGNLGRSEQHRYNKRQSGDKFDLPRSCTGAMKKRGKLGDNKEQEPNLSRIRSFEGELCNLNQHRVAFLCGVAQMVLYKASVGEDREMAVAAPTSASAGAAISELLHFPRFGPGSLESLRRLQAHSHLASVARMPSFIHSGYPSLNLNFSLPVMGMPMLPYDPILALRRAELLYEQPATHSLQTLLSSLGGNAHHINDFPVAAHFASLVQLQNKMYLEQLSLPTSAHAAATVQSQSEEVNSSSQFSNSPRTIRAHGKVPKVGRSLHRQQQNNEDEPPVTRMSLYMSDDRGKLNDNQIFLRRQIEIFKASNEDILTLTRGKNKPIVLQQVGIRCRFCSQVPVGKRRKGSTYFPSNLMGLYQAAQNLSVEHLQSGLCPELPPDVKERFLCIASGIKSVASCAGKKYWAEAGRMLGLIDTEDGIRFAEDVGEAVRRLAGQSI